MDDIIIKKGTDVVLNRDLNVREVTVARKGLKVACEKDIKKGANFVRWVIIVVIILTALNLFGIIDPKPFFNQLLSAK